MSKERVDVLAYKQGLFETREQAKRGVMAGLVVNVINGERFDKPGEKIDDTIELKLKGEKLRYVSRGGLKLEKALKVFDISIKNKVTIDIGASTGGFTDVMLQNGAKKVYAVDVGTNQLVWKLRQDERVISMEQYNFRYAEVSDFTDELPQFASIDVSFISLNLILPALSKLLSNGDEVVALIKPQFEAGREQIGKNGIIRDKTIHYSVLEKVTDFAQDYEFTIKGLDFSPIQGGHGNIEFLVHLEKSDAPKNQVQDLLHEVVEKAHREFKKMKKSDRLELIRKIVLSRDIETQNELLAVLNQEGLHLTQATISRDMNEIGIVKVPSGNGNYIYGLSKESSFQNVRKPKPIKTTILAVTEKVSGLEKFIHLDVVPGNSRLIKRYIMEDFSESIFSIIVDDESLLIIAKEEEKADLIRQEVSKWMTASQD